MKCYLNLNKFPYKLHEKLSVKQNPKFGIQYKTLLTLRLFTIMLMFCFTYIIKFVISALVSFLFDDLPGDGVNYLYNNHQISFIIRLKTISLKIRLSATFHFIFFFIIHDR